MEGYGVHSAIGSTHRGAVHSSANGISNEGAIDIIGDNNEKEAAIEHFGRQFASMEESDNFLEEFRSDTLNDISSGLNVLASGIKVITTILSLFGADTVDRNDNFEQAMGTMMSLGATVLKVGVTKMLEPSSTASTSSSVNKIGEAAATSPLTQEEKLHQQQVQAFVSKLTPEQIKLQQQLVQEHVDKQAQEQNLNSIQAAQLLSETLSHNGLPQINSSVENTLATVVNTVSEGESLVTDMFSSIFGDSTVNKVGVAAGAASDQGDHIPGLPKPGTLEHTITLALFKAQQSLNQMLSGGAPAVSGQPAIDNKLGVAADAVVTESDGGIMATVGALPQSVGNAAVKLMKFITPPASEAVDTAGRPGVTYSEVTSGPDPSTYAALGLLTTGALGTVLYSYVATDSNLASSATALAKGAVDAIKRNDILQVATNAFASVTGNKFVTQEDTGNLNYNYYDQENIQDNSGYSDYGYGYPPPTYPDTQYTEQNDYGYGDPYAEYPDQDPYQGYATQETRQDPQLAQKYPHAIPDGTQFYEPESAAPDVPYVTYTEEHSPWELIHSGQPTDHLYRSFRT